MFKPLLLVWARGFTEMAQRQAGKAWDLEAQEKKMREELDEFFAALKIYVNSLESSDKLGDVVEEFWDCFFSNLAMLHLMGIPDGEILGALKRVTDKLNNRLIGGYFLEG